MKTAINPLERELEEVRSLADLAGRELDLLSSPVFAGAWRPAVDVIETESGYTLKLELPEVDRKDVHLRVEGDTLTVTGERRGPEVDGERLLRSERCYGSFCRAFDLPESVDRDKIRASFKDGVMSITLPKKEEVRPREIEIRAA